MLWILFQLPVPNRKIQTPPKTTFLSYFSEFFEFFHKITQNMTNHFAKSLYNFWEPAWNKFSIHAGCFLLPRLLLVNFLPILCSLCNSIMNIISLFESWNTSGALWEENILFENRAYKGNGNKRQLQSFCFIFVIF